MAGGLGLLFRLFLYWLIAWKNELGDASGYELIATNILQHGIYSHDAVPPLTPSLLRPPVLPFFLSAHFAVFGSFLPALVTQSLLGLLRSAVLAETFERLSPGAGPSALWVLLLSPFDAIYDVAELTESLTTTFLVLGVCAPLLLRGHSAGWILCGCLLGATVLTRDIFLAFVPMVAALAFFLEAGKKRLLASSLVVIGALVVIAPWTMRNRAVTGRWVAVTEGLLGRALWVGSWATAPVIMSNAAEYSYRTEDERAAVQRALAEPDLKLRDGQFLALALDRYQAEPVRVVLRWLGRVRLMWLGTRYEIFDFGPEPLQRGKPGWFAAKSMLYGLNSLLLLLGTAGLLIALRQRHMLFWLAAPVLYNLVVFLPLNAWEQRYSQPALPFLTVFALWSLLLLRAWLRSRQSVGT